MFNYGRWLWVAVILMAISTGITAAQPVDYCISVRGDTNLRTSYSLNSRVWTIASAGSVLHVTYEGMQGNWLKVNYLDGSAWIARWLHYSRVSCPGDSPVPVAAQPQSQPAQPASSGVVDNMCQIGWVCTTPADWERGWYAYRDGQTQQQTSTTTTTTATTTPQTDESEDGTYLLPAGCYESSRTETSWYSSSTITCESDQKITDPIPLSFFKCDAYISYRSASLIFDTWLTFTTYTCD